MNELRIIAITHKNFSLETIGKFHIPDSERIARLENVKVEAGMSELMYLTTCNRVELIFSLPHFVCPGVAANILCQLQPNLSAQELKEIAHSAERFNGLEAAEHLLRVASGVDSLVIGEREIITQLRKAYEECSESKLCGDDIRVLVSQAVKTAKEIFTNTDLAKKPVSVVSLAWQHFRQFGVKQDARILLIGAGQVVRNFTKYLFENNYHNITIANRSIENAETLTSTFSGKSIALNELAYFTEGFDVMISCTSSQEAIINSVLYSSLLNDEQNQKLVIDLAVPSDIDKSVVEKNNLRYIDMSLIRQLASENIQFREKALEDCNPILDNGLKEFEKVWQSRQIERAMQSIPETIKEIRNTALGSVFAKDLENLDENSRELLEKIMNYMEKKYISIPMKMAREVLMSEVKKN